MRYALVGDGESPHLLKWARALAPLVDLWVCSSRGFAPELAARVPAEKRLALNTDPAHAGGNAALLKQLPAVGRWLQQVDADWINPHYLTSHGALVLLALGVPLLVLCRWLWLGGLENWMNADLWHSLRQTLVLGASGALLPAGIITDFGIVKLLKRYEQRTWEKARRRMFRRR